MSEPAGSNLPKLPFYVADALLSAVCLYGLYKLGAIQGWEKGMVAVGCVLGGAVGAWLAVLPWLKQYEVETRQDEGDRLYSAVQQIQKLEEVAKAIQTANLGWSGMQESNKQTIAAAQQISERMKAEAAEFVKFLDQSETQEKAAMRLEIQKARKMEEEWLQVLVRMMDHVFALYSAGARSGQKHLISQFEHFQAACRDAVRRVGLLPFAPAPQETFDERVHQNADQNVKPGPGAVVGETVATGYTFQGALLRRALVRTTSPQAQEAVAPPAEETPEEEKHPQLPL